MEISPFANVWSKGSTERRHTVYGFHGDSKCFPGSNSEEEVNEISYFGGDSIEVPLSVKQRAYDKIMKEVLQNKSEHPKPSSLCFHLTRPTKEVSMNQIMMSSHMSGVSEESPCPARSIRHLRTRQRRRKRKIKREDDSSDYEISVTQRLHVRGRTRRGQKVSTLSTKLQGRLDSGAFLRYFTHIWSDFPEEKLKSVTYLDPLWFNLYTKEKSRFNVLKWIKMRGVFSKKYVLVPIVLWSHWNLLILCNLGESLQSKTNTPCLLLLDSLQAFGPTRLEPLIRRFLLDLYNEEQRQETIQELKKIRLLTPKVPQQVKGDECGYYVLHYITQFLENAPERFNISEGYPYFMKEDWFTVEDMDSFYKRLDAFPAESSGPYDAASMDPGDCVEVVEGSFEEVDS